jgi:hypothetical protein
MVEYENDELEQDCEEGQELASLLGGNGDISQGDVPQKRESSSDDDSTGKTSRRQIILGLLTAGLLLFGGGVGVGQYFSPQSSTLASVNSPSLNDVPPSTDLASHSNNQGNQDHGAVVSGSTDLVGTNELTDTTSAEDNPPKPVDTTEAVDSSSSPKEKNASNPTGEASENTEHRTSPQQESITSDSSSAIDESLFVPHAPFGHNLNYRRVCARVHSSILCMIMRFPFAVLEQDPNFAYPHPVDERYYKLEKDARFLSTDELRRCITDEATLSLSMDDRVKACLDYVATTAGGDPDTSVFAVWTRRRLDATETQFYGLHLSPQQGERIDKFFDKHVILVLGASPTPSVTQCMAELFGGCTGGGIKPVSYLCKGHEGRRVRFLGNTNSYPKLDLNQTFIGSGGWYPQDISHGRTHRLPQNLTMQLAGIGFAREPGFKELRKVSLIIEYPIAHAQNQDMIFNEWEEVEKIQNGLPKMVTDLYSETGKRELAEMGYEVGHLIAYDGIPQHNPSVTGGFPWDLKQSVTNTMEKFENKSGYPGWIPDYGKQCRGPLPPSSKLTYVNSLSKQGFEDNAFDMNFYGRTWEFANSWWFQTAGWKNARIGLDCTHTGASSGMSCVHKYFLMAMVDDHFDNIES